MQLLLRPQVSCVFSSVISFKNSGQLLGGDTASLGPQDRFQRQKRINDEVTVIDGNSIPESGLLRYFLYESTGYVT